MSRQGAARTIVALMAAVGLAVLGAGCQHQCPMHHHDHGGKTGAPGVTSGAAAVNEQCPIMGGKVEAGLTREYKGQTVGFCCGGCPDAWDKLTDAQKDAKLAKVLPKHKH